MTNQRLALLMLIQMPKRPIASQLCAKCFRGRKGGQLEMTFRLSEPAGRKRLGE